MTETSTKAPLSLTELQNAARIVAGNLRAAASKPLVAGGGSQQRGLPETLQAEFIAVRALLFHRGIFDPVLVRFDTASAPPAENAAIADQLMTIADGLASS